MRRRWSNTPGDTSNEVCVLNGVPSSIVVDPAGAYAYAIINATSACDTSTSKSTTGILAFKINSDGTTTSVGSLVPFARIDSRTITVSGMMAMDAAGKFLFVADRGTTWRTLQVSGAVSVFAIGSGASPDGVPGSFAFPPSLR